jgi:hypothetical protein
LIYEILAGADADLGEPRSDLGFGGMDRRELQKEVQDIKEP